jgi:hypothetical protein
MRREFVPVGMLVLLMVLAFSAQLALVGAQNSSVGVQVGNYFEYDVSLSGSQAQIVGLRAYGVTNVTATVSDVTGSNVTYSLEGQYQNGTDKKTTVSVDVSTGESENKANVAIDWNLVAANLSVDEPTYPNSGSWANETVTIGGRPTDHSIQSNVTGAENDTLDAYWDVATGVPVNVSEVDTVTGEGVTLNMSYVLVATNAWTTVVPEFSPLVMVIIMTALVGVAGATARRRKERSLPLTRVF